MRSRSSSPKRAPPQTRVLGVRAPRALLDVVYTSHGGLTGSPTCRGIRFAALSCNEWAVSGSRRRGSGRRQEKYVESCVSEAVGGPGWLTGRPPRSIAEKLTLSQKLGVCSVRETLHALGPWRRLDVNSCALRVPARICSWRQQCSAPKDLLLCRVT